MRSWQASAIYRSMSTPALRPCGSVITSTGICSLGSSWNSYAPLIVVDHGHELLNSGSNVVLEVVELPPGPP